MKLNLPSIKDVRIFIIEGIAGSGKDTFQKNLSKYFDKNNFLVYTFSEEELLFSWKHFWIKNMEIYRINYFHSLLDYCEELINENRRNVIVLNRFHITYAIFSKYNQKTKKLYEKLVNRLKNLPVHIFIGKLSLDKIEQRARHPERKEKIWRIHQQKRVKLANVKSLAELYKNEQEIIFKIAQKQRIPYSIFELD
jgi:thymidylate kinase